MNENRILITGASGFLGQGWLKSLQQLPHYTPIAHFRNNPVMWFDGEAIGLDLTIPRNVKTLINNSQPVLVINTVGATNVELCEADPELAYTLNEGLPRTLAQQCAKAGIKFVHISTDHLFSKGNGPFRESDLPSPINIYGKSKLGGERAVLEECPNALVIRTNFFGLSNTGLSSLTEWILDGLKNGLERKLFRDVYFSPLLIETLVSHVTQLIEKDASGLYHVAGPEQLTKYQFGLKLSRAFGYSTDLIKKANITERKDLCVRPRHMGLNTDKLQATIKTTLPPLDIDLQSLVGSAPDRIVWSNCSIPLLGANETARVLPYGRHTLDEEDIKAVVKCLQNGVLTQGSEIEEFEKAIAKRVGAKYAVAVSSGTAGLHLACRVVGLGKADKAITTSMTFVATANSVAYVGAKPIFVDIVPETINLCPQAVTQALVRHPETKAILPVHFGGLACDMAVISRMGWDHGCSIIEDASHALGARYASGEPVGCCKYSDMTVFSFHPVKLIAAGEGGLVTTNNEKYYRSLLRLRSHGINKLDDRLYVEEEAFTGDNVNPWYYEMQELGFQYRITDIQSALGRSQLTKLSAFVERRRQLVKWYDKQFADVSNVTPCQVQSRELSSHHLYVLRISFDSIKKSRAELISYLRNAGVGSQVHYLPVPMHPYYRHLGYTMTDLPAAEQYYRECLSIPLYFDLDRQSQEGVVRAIKAGILQ